VCRNRHCHDGDANDGNGGGDDNTSFGSTVVSGTHREDRQKDVNATSPDQTREPKPVSFFVRRACPMVSMPHGLCHMIYEEDGRIFEGDWCMLLDKTNNCHPMFDLGGACVRIMLVLVLVTIVGVFCCSIPSHTLSFVHGSCSYF
jgi:hypothetical protein